MKYKVGDVVWLNGPHRPIKTYEWEIVGIEIRNPFLVRIRERGTDYQPSWIDISLITKATPSKT